MERVDRFNKAYEYLKNRGVVHTQKELAAKMQATAPHVSLAMKGESKYLTDNFLRRFNDTFDSIFNLQWLILGEGDMLKEGEEDEVEITTQDQTVLRLIDELSAQRKMTEKALEHQGRLMEQNDRLITLLEKEAERTQAIMSLHHVG